jgi:dihydroflavonol-4-reductase
LLRNTKERRKNMAKTALVTGACGFTGTNMIQLLTGLGGWKIVATDLKKEEHGEYYCEAGNLTPVYLDDALKHPSVEFIPADLTKKESLAPLFKYQYDAVFHIASLYDYFAQWDVLHKVNVVGVENLVSLCAEHKVKRFIHWSTDGVYGEIENPPGDENHPFNPPNLYSKSKVAQEEVVWRYHKEKGLPVTVLRPAPIYGPHHRYGVFHILHSIQKMGTGVIVQWFPKDKTLYFPSVHVLDLVRSAVFAAENDKTIGQAYNILSTCIPQTDFLEFCYHSLGLEKIIRFPIWWPAYKAFAAIALWYATKLDVKARARNGRPKLDVPMVGYITHQYHFSNQKLKNLGFKYVYDDPRKGIWDYITWCKERGLLR